MATTSLEERTFLELRLAAVLKRAGEDDNADARALVGELWGHRRGDAAPCVMELPAAEALGQSAAEAGASVDEVVRRLLQLSRAIAAEAHASGGLEPPVAHRLAEVADEAAARAAGAHARWWRERREAWLSYLCHELKNPLNTVLNALWLLREPRPQAQSARFVELAERAVRRIEAGVDQVRDLHRRAALAPPTKPGPGLGVAAEPRPPR